MRSLNLRKAEARRRPEDLFSTNMGSEVHGLNLKKAEARTRPEGVSSANTGSEVRGLSLKRAEARTRPEDLSSTNMGFRGAWSEAEEDRGGDKAGALILNQYGFPRCGI